MDGQTKDDIGPQVRRYLLVFYVLMFGTLVTVGASYIPFGSPAVNIAVALFIAAGKASLVAGYFMHLLSERKVIYGLLAFTLVFVLGLAVLTMWAFSDVPHVTKTH